MYIGHYGAAELLLDLNKTIPPLPVLIGVAYPDLLWPFLVYFKKERVEVNPKSPLQNEVKFIHYPYSHSLVRSALLTLIPAVIAGLLYQRLIVGVFFYVAALSHWLLDLIMHLPDLPLLGFGSGRKVGLGLWRHLKTSFVFEYVFFAVCTLLFTKHSLWIPLFLTGLVLHMFNANSFFGFTKKNNANTPNAYATLALVGFGIATLAFGVILS